MQNYVIQRVYDRATFYNSLQHQLLRQYAAAASARVSSKYTLAGASVELNPVKVPCVSMTQHNNKAAPTFATLQHSSLPISLQDSLHGNIITINKYHRNKAHFISDDVHHGANVLCSNSSDASEHGDNA